MRKSLGLEIGTAEIRWVELEEERGHIAVRASGTAAVETGGERTVGETLRALVAERRWKGREVAVSLPRSSVTLRWVLLPLASREETAGMVELEAVQSLPFPTEDAAWDFVSFPAPDSRQEVLMVAARRQLVQELRRLVESAGLRVGAVSVDALAAAALFHELRPDSETGAVLLHLEGEIATFSCVRDGRLLLSRSVSPGRLDAETLAVELRRTLVAGMMTGHNAAVPPAASAVWLTGEGADEVLAEELAAILGLTMERGRGDEGAYAESTYLPSRTVHAGLPRGRLAGGSELWPSLDTALGLALLALRPAAERLDLARAMRAETERSAAGPARRLPLLAGAGVAALAVTLLVLFGPGAGDRDLAAAASRAQSDVRQMASRRQQLEEQMKQLTGAVTPAHSYLDVLNEVSALAGPDAWLTQYTYQRGHPIVIRGMARSDDAVERLLEGLRRSPHLEQVALGPVTRPDADKKQPVSLVEFTITGSLPGDQPLEARRRRVARPVRQTE